MVQLISSGFFFLFATENRVKNGMQTFECWQLKWSDSLSTHNLNSFKNYSLKVLKFLFKSFRFF